MKSISSNPNKKPNRALLVLCAIVAAAGVVLAIFVLSRSSHSSMFYVPLSAKGEKLLLSRPAPSLKPSQPLALFLNASFDPFELCHWKEQVRSGHTLYEIAWGQDDAYLKATSDASASALVRKIRFDPSEYPILTWRWKVENVVEGADLRTPSGSDAAARLYVIFEGSPFIWNSKLVNYVWATSLQKGAHLDSVFSRNSKMIALESGHELVGQWVIERRNIYEDFRTLFGRKPREVTGIALMTDTDNSRRRVVAYYDDIRIGKE